MSGTSHCWTFTRFVKRRRRFQPITWLGTPVSSSTTSRQCLESRGVFQWKCLFTNWLSLDGMNGPAWGSIKAGNSYRLFSYLPVFGRFGNCCKSFPFPQLRVGSLRPFFFPCHSICIGAGLFSLRPWGCSSLYRWRLVSSRDTRKKLALVACRLGFWCPSRSMQNHHLGLGMRRDRVARLFFQWISQEEGFPVGRGRWFCRGATTHSWQTLARLR